MPLKDEIQYVERLSTVSKDILKSLLYFNVFRYPLTIRDIFLNSSIENGSINEISKELEVLLERQLIRRKDDYYYLWDETTIKKRIKGNTLSLKYLKMARYVGKFISCFPFIRGVYISGSLSKGYMDKDSDIDFFVITAPGRLWFSRTMIILFKKLFLFNSRKFLCPNYFIDTDHLELPEHNIFTAKELKYLIPLYNEDLYKQLLKSNEWTEAYMPNFSQIYETPFSGNPWFKILFEKIFGGRIGTWLDNFCLNITEKFWRRKYRNKISENDIRIQCKKHTSKFHPKGFQSKVIEKYNANIKEFEKTHEIRI
jgi:hypothetical protein